MNFSQQFTRSSAYSFRLRVEDELLDYLQTMKKHRIIDCGLSSYHISVLLLDRAKGPAIEFEKDPLNATEGKLLFGNTFY